MCRLEIWAEIEYTHILVLILMYINIYINISHDTSDDVCYKKNQVCVRGERRLWVPSCEPCHGETAVAGAQ